MSVRRGSAVIVNVLNDNPNELEPSKLRKGIVVDVDAEGVATVAYATKHKRETYAVMIGPKARGIGRALNITCPSYFNGDVVRVQDSELTEKCLVGVDLRDSVSDAVGRKQSGA